MPVLRDWELALDADKVLWGQTPRRVRARRPKLAEIAEAAIAEGPLIADHLAAASEVIVAVCTIEDDVTRAISERFQSDPVRALALEGVAGAAVEALAEAVCRRFDALALAEGLKTSITLNPGMIGWPLEEGQTQIFGLLDATEIGVSLDPGTSIMRPLKSISLVIGLGRDLNPTGQTCDFCSMRETCRYKDHYGGPNKPDDVSG